MDETFNPFTRKPDFLGGGGVAIGEAIGNSPEINGFLFADEEGNLQNNILHYEDDPFFGVVPRLSLYSDNVPDTAFTFFDATGVGFYKGARIGLPADGGAFLLGVSGSIGTNFLYVTYDGSTGRMSFDPTGSGVGNVFILNNTKAELMLPLDMNSHLITELTPGSATGHGVEFDQMNTAIDDALAGFTVDINDIVPDQTGHANEFLMTDGSVVSWEGVSASPAGSDGQIQINNSGSFGADADLYWLSAFNVLRSVNGGMQVSPGHSTFGYGDTDGNGKVTFDSNSIRLYGYGSILLADGTGNYGEISRSRIAHGIMSINTTPIGGGQFDYGLQFGEAVTAYLGTGIGAGYVPRLIASANNDLLIGSYHYTDFQLGAYTGTTKYNDLFANSLASVIGAGYIAHASQSVDMVQWLKSDRTVMAAIAKNGALKLPTLTDAQAENGTLFIGSDHSDKLCFKDGSGTVNVVY